MYHRQQNEWYPPNLFARPFRSYNLIFFIVANLLAHNNISKIC